MGVRAQAEVMDDGTGPQSSCCGSDFLLTGCKVAMVENPLSYSEMKGCGAS